MKAGFSVLALLLLLLAGEAQPSELALSGIAGGRAVIVMDNGPPQILSVGKTTPGGVRLLSLDGNTAIVEFEGRRQTLRLGERVVRQSSGGAGQAGVGTLTGEEARKVLARGVEVTIDEDSSGHFYIDGEINGRAAHFLVDTGATYVCIGYSAAQAMGLALDDKKTSKASTAGGIVKAWHVTLRSVKIGGLRFEDVEGTVLQTEMPQALLGMSILERMEMRRDGKQMRLKKKL